MQTDLVMDAAKMWTDATRSYAEAASTTWWTMTSRATEFWAMPATAFMAAAEASAKPGPKSWYRKPVETPLDMMMSWFAPSFQAAASWPPSTPFAWFPDFGKQQAAMAWPAFTPFSAGPFGFDRMFSAMQLAMAAAPLQQAMSQFAGTMTSNMPPASYAAFRTDGGHATTHVTMGAARMLSVLVPMLIALSAMVFSLAFSSPTIA